MPTLEDGRNAINHGNLQQARLIFEAILQENPRSEDAWLGLAEVLSETDDKRICYENVLKINRENRAAREGLRSLEPQADPLVIAMRQQTGARNGEDADTETDEESDFQETVPTNVVAVQADRETPTPVLVAIGLALSVVAFAIGGGVVFFLLSSLAGG
jgi:thioredoxin-like negative regulator of GroEL